jgi:hypothetical protein
VTSVSHLQAKHGAGDGQGGPLGPGGEQEEHGAGHDGGGGFRATLQLGKQSENKVKIK